MDNNIAINSTTFSLVASDIKEGSLRRDVSRGVSLPEVIRIKHSTVTDSASKRRVNRSLCQIERTVACAEGGVIPVLAHVVVTVPADTVVPTSEVDAVLSHLITLLASPTVTGGLNAASDIFVKRLQ